MGGDGEWCGSFSRIRDSNDQQEARAVQFQYDVHDSGPGWQRLVGSDGCPEQVEPQTNHGLSQVDLLRCTTVSIAH